MTRFSAKALTLAGAALLALPIAAAAQSADELAKQTQNPVASLISVPLQGNWDFGLAERDAIGTTLNVQPVMPFAVSKSTNLILRVIMPLTSQPAPDGSASTGSATSSPPPSSRRRRPERSPGASGRSSCCRPRRATRSAPRSSASARRRWSSRSRASGRSAPSSTTSGR